MREMEEVRKNQDEELVHLKQDTAMKMREAMLDRCRLMQQIEKLSNGSIDSDLAVVSEHICLSVSVCVFLYVCDSVCLTAVCLSLFVSVTVCMSLSVCLCLFVCMFLSVYLCLSVSVCHCLYVCVSVYLTPICLSLSVCLCLSVTVCMSLSVCLSLSDCVCLSVCHHVFSWLQELSMLLSSCCLILFGCLKPSSLLLPLLL